MGEICMRLLAQILSGVTYFVGTIISILSKISPLMDDSISLLAGVIGLIGGVIWVLVSYVKLKREKIEKRIAELELKRLEESE